MKRWPRLAWSTLFSILAAVAIAPGCGDDTGSGATNTESPDNVRVESDAGPTGNSGTVDAANDVPFSGECRDDADCSDGIFCNGIERCFDNECFTSPVRQCADPSECTEDVCDEENERCEFIPDDSLCAPGQVCDSKAGCFTPSNCSIDADCDDGLLCNGTERCVEGDCAPGTPVECDDDIDCTVDSCVEGIGECQSIADHTLCLPTELCGRIAGCTARPPCTRDDDCDDGLFCNGTETCVDGLCEPGAPPEVVDSVDCTIDQCSETQSMVLHTPDSARCSDGEFCNGAEVCHPTDGCVPGTPPVLSDGVGCTADSCDEDLDFIEHTPDDSVCDDGLFCNGDEVCHPIDDCSPGEPPMLNDGVGCTNDVCDEVNDTVLHVPDDSVCDDGLFCNGSEVCDEVDDCQAGDPPEPDDGVTCTVDTCDESADEFVHTPDDSACDDTLSCNGDETCDPVDDCQPGTPIPTDDGIDCTIDMCDETNGVVHMPDNSLCDDGDFCNGEETCDPTAGCQAGTPPTPPDDGVACTVAVCNEADDDFDHVPDDSLCDDDLFCDGAEYCDSNTGCEDGTPPTVDDNEPCTTDACDEGNDEVTHDPVSDGTTCNTSDICVDGTCGTSVCGDGYVDSSTGEECDDGNTSPGDGCDENCKTETQTCDPDGTWDLPGADRIQYACCFGLVDVDITAFIFSSDGASVQSSPSNPQTMTGTATTCPSGNFSVSSTIAGGCDETYALSGSFDDADNWTGVYSLTFTGSDCDCFGGADTPCVDQTYPISATRR